MIIVRILLVLIHINSTVCRNSIQFSIQFAFFFVTRLDIIIIAKGTSFIIIFISCFSSIKVRNGLKKQVWNVGWPIRSQCTLSLPPENIRKLYGFVFRGVEKGYIANKWVNIKYTIWNNILIGLLKHLMMWQVEPCGKKVFKNRNEENLTSPLQFAKFICSTFHELFV